MAKGFKTGGAKKGSVYAKAALWQEMGDWIASEGTDKYMEYLKSLEGEDYARRFEAILEYFKPKLARSEMTGKDGESLKINVISYGTKRPEQN
jgi:hypothetical protein